MNNRIKSIIITVTAIVLAFSLLIACDGNVITNTDNGRAYTEVIATNGAFVYKGQSYDFLEDVLNVIKKAGAQEGAVKVSGNVSSRPVVIPEGLDISIDLNGNEISFFDVKDSAVKVSGGSDLYVSKGTLALSKPNKNLAVISSEGTDTEIHLSANVKIEGAVVASDGATLNAANYLKDVRMQGGNLIVEDNGIAVVTENTGTNTYAESPHGTIVDMTSSIESGQIQNGYWYVERDGHKTFYGGLEEAVDSLEPSDVELVLIGDETVTPAASITLNQNIRLILRGYDTGTYNIILANGADLTINGTEGSSFTGTITSEEEGNSTLTAEGIGLFSTIDVSGNVSLTKVNGTAGAIKSDGSVSIDNNGSDSGFSSGAISAKEEITVSSDQPTGIGGATGKTVSINGIVGISGNVKATVDIEITGGAAFESSPSVTSTEGNISMTSVKGSAGDIKTEASGKTITIDNTSSSNVLGTGKITTNGGAVAVNGNESSNLPVTINGDVNCSSFNVNNTVIKGDVTTSGNIDVEESSFGTAGADLTSTNGNITITDSTGTAGNLAAENGDVTVENPNTTTPVLTVGDIDGIAVAVTGNENSLVHVDGSVDADTSFEGNYCLLGNGGGDYIYSPSVDIDNSGLHLTAIAAGNTGTEYIPATISIDNPLSGEYYPSVGNLCANQLTVTDTPRNLSVNNATLSGNNTSNTINGGSYTNFNYNGTEPGKLTITDGFFGTGTGTGEFNHSGSGNVDVSGGAFDCVYNHSGSGVLNVSGGDYYNTLNHTGTGALNISVGSFASINEASGAGATTIANNASVYIRGDSTQPNFATVNYFMGKVGSGKTVSLNYYPTGLVYLADSAGVSFSNTAGGSVNLNLMYSADSYGTVSSGIVVNSVIENPSSINFGTGITVGNSTGILMNKGTKFTSSKDIDGKVFKYEDNKKGDSISASAPDYTYTFPDVVLSSAVDVPPNQAIVATCMLYDVDGNEIGVATGSTGQGVGRSFIYYYLNSTANIVQVKGVLNDYEKEHHWEEYAIVYEQDVDSNDDRAWAEGALGSATIAALGDLLHPSGDYSYSYYDACYSRSGGVWTWINGEYKTGKTIGNDSIPMFNH